MRASMNSSDNEKRIPEVLTELPREPLSRRVLRGLCGVVVFLFFAGGVGMIYEIISHFFPWLGVIAPTLAILIALGAIYGLIHDDMERHKETERQMKLYRWEAQQLKDAAETAIQIKSTFPLYETLKNIAIMEGETDGPKA